MLRRLVKEFVIWVVAAMIFAITFIYLFFCWQLVFAQELTMYDQHQNGMFSTLGNIVMIEMGDTIHAYSVGSAEYELARPKFRPQEVEESESGSDQDINHETWDEMSHQEKAEHYEKNEYWSGAAMEYEYAGMFDKAKEMYILIAEDAASRGYFFVAADNYIYAFQPEKAAKMAKKLVQSNNSENLWLASQVYQKLGMKAEYQEIITQFRDK